MADQTCAHLSVLPFDEDPIGAAPDSTGCVDCLASGGSWVHLRRCVGCGHVGCCDSSPNRHASSHFRSSEHPVMQSYEPGEEWLWCFVDETAVEPDSPAPSPAHP